MLRTQKGVEALGQPGQHIKEVLVMSDNGVTLKVAVKCQSLGYKYQTLRNDGIEKICVWEQA